MQKYFNFRVDLVVLLIISNFHFGYVKSPFLILILCSVPWISYLIISENFLDFLKLWHILNKTQAIFMVVTVFLNVLLFIFYVHLQPVIVFSLLFSILHVYRLCLSCLFPGVYHTIGGTKILVPTDMPWKNQEC